MLSGRDCKELFMTWKAQSAGLQRNNARAPHLLRTEKVYPLFSFG